MTRKLVFRLVHDEARKNAIAALSAAPAGYVCVIQEETRTLEANALLWPCLRLLSKNVPLLIDGEKVFMEEEVWKDIVTATHRGEQMRMCNYKGALIMVGRSTSQMGRSEFSELLTYVLSEIASYGLQLPPREAADIDDYIRRHGNART